MTKRALRTTPEEFGKFKSECLRLIEKLGLQDWDMTFLHKQMPKRDVAQFEYDFDTRMGSLQFNTLKRSENEDPEQIAKHECAHALLVPLVELAESRFVTQKEITRVVEALATKLEKVL
jgi:hypothetical protein